MNRIKRGQLNATTVIACLALFLAMGGWAVAAFHLKKNAVKTKNIKNGAVTNKKIAKGAVNADSLASGTVKATDIGNGSITGAKLANGSVSQAKFAAAALGSGPQQSIQIANHDCVPVMFSAPGVTPGDVAFYSVAPTVVSSTTVVPGANTVPAPGKLQLGICNDSGNTQTYPPNSVTVGYVAVRP